MNLRRFICALGLVACVPAIPISEQQVLSDLDRQKGRAESTRQLSGRFLHITDFHLDTHYEPGTSVRKACHRGKGGTGSIGAEGTDCDSPSALINETFRWIEKNLKDKIDFVLWTGDSARHDNDEKIPRSPAEIIDLNEILANKFIDVFEDSDALRGLSIPIIPTIGNNDIMPHNIFKQGPNRWTRRFTEVWAKFIPEHERHTFEEGGWFSADLIPNKLAAISLNTMYFYESNSAVDGCAAKSEPGFEHMEWLRIQLEQLRQRDMKAILIGHVPPARAGSKRNWDESCWQKYTLFLNRFRDVVVGSVYGHMNIDHFMLQDSRNVDIIAAGESTPNEPDLVVQSRSNYLSRLRKEWAGMPTPPDDMSSKFFFSDDGSPETQDDDVDISAEALGKKERRFLRKIGGPWAERYSVSLVSPSVVPNYFPTLRVIEYNVTGLEGATTWADSPDSNDFESSLSDAEDAKDIEDIDTSDEVDQQGKKKKKKGKKKKKTKKPHFKIPDHPSPTSPPGPAYSNQALTWLSYTQYYANLTMIYDQAPDTLQLTAGPHTTVGEHEAEHPDLYQIEYDTKDDDIYRMEDLTVRSYFKLAKRISNKNPKKGDMMAEQLKASDPDDDEVSEAAKKRRKKRRHKNRVWRTFLERAFVGFLSDDELDDILK
ncbi:Metallo-dependent phosphatase-like protein [Aspergillus egyptiacus]|nr:Metallo-dependent phosphatase-like protein [Aspergillus egyptiacus]